MKDTGTWLRHAAAVLDKAGCDTPRLDAECLLAHAWGMNRSQLFSRMKDPIPEDVLEKSNALISLRAKREPLAHITGRREFWSRNFEVSPATLIPRPETEHLIEAALRHFPDQDIQLSFCDLGTGSGCIAITLALEYPHALGIGCDIDYHALQCAKRNAKRHNVSKRLRLIQADMLSAFSSSKHFDLIIANPPYVAADEMSALEPELGYEPRHALTDGMDGMSYLRKILQSGDMFLRENGRIIVETGICGLPETPSGLIRLETLHDLSGQLRGAVYRRALPD
ncbi:MAG: peptide chain release factor N(5)-glutamine methyltransferase [Zetaproteobacteria bacterium]|nr:MAG: peptide chain release factor N(5)-glutamine methyltransferase [Zetaproteobacteria bacterium]